MAEKTKKEVALETPEDLDEFMAGEPKDFDPDEAFGVETKKPAKAPPEDDLELPEIKEDEAREDDMLDIAADVPVQVVAVMGKKNITIKEIASLRLGEVLELNRPANEIVDLVAGGKLIAKGELVEIEGKMGVRIVKMVR